MTTEPTSSIKQSFDDGDAQFQAALLKVRDEFLVLTAGNLNKMDVKGAIELREYIRKRTDLEKPDEQLTPEQRAWKIMFGSVDELLAESLGKDEKEKLDKLRLELDQIDLVKDNVDKLFQMGRQIEELMIYQQGYLSVHFSDNKYRENEEKLSADMLADSTPNQTKIEIARDIIQRAEQYKELMLKPLFDYQDKIYGLLSKFRTLYKETPFAVGRDVDEIQKIETLYAEWLSLTQDLHKERLKVITAVRNLVELDAFVPTHIIKNNGDKTVDIPAEELAPKFAAADVLLKDGHSKEQEIAKKRDPLSIEAFGSPDSYMKIAQDEETAQDDAPQKPKKEGTRVNPLQEKAWFRFLKVLYIVACVLAGLLSAGLLAADKTQELGIYTAAVLVVILVAVRKGFYYVALGKTTWK